MPINITNTSFQKIVSDIKSLKIQGAEAVAKSAVEALNIVLNKSKAETPLKLIQEIEKAKKILLESRPTEPAMRNGLNYVTYNLIRNDISKIKKEAARRINFVLEHFKNAQKTTEEIISQKIKKGMIVYTHCHSSTVTNALIRAKKEGIKFEVHNTETRPLFQGRITATELAKVGIPVTFYVDSAARLALKKADIALLGADAITADGKVINKIGSELIAEIAHKLDVPLYICTDSWKFDSLTIRGKDTKIEERSPDEVWKNPPKNIRVANFAFEKIKPELITGIITEVGIYRPSVLIEEIKSAYPWMFKF